jgi:hypothetical protein
MKKITQLPQMLFITIALSLSATSAQATENKIECWLADEYLTKGNASAEKSIQIQVVKDVINMVGSISKTIPPLAICDTKVVNAWVTIAGNPLVITTGMLNIIGTDNNIIAALVGHEISHLVLKHLKQENDLDPILRRDAERIGPNVTIQGGTYDLNTIKTIVYVAKRKALNRKFESEADDLGIQFASKAGYEPEGARKLFNLMVSSGVGRLYAEFFDDHPGFFERYAQAESRVIDEHFDQIASRNLENNDWVSLEDNVNQWLLQFPYSPNAWFYNAKLQGRISKDTELEALENAFTYSTPTLSKKQAQLDASYLKLCTDLYWLGHKLESAICSKSLSQLTLKEEFNRQTFRGVVIDLGNPPPPLKLLFLKDEEGGKLITDRGWPDKQPVTETPSWKPIRYISANRDTEGN